MTCLLQFFFIKTSSNWFTIQVTNHKSPRNCVFTFTNNKNFFRPILSVPFSKNVSVFWNPNMVTNFNFMFGYIRIFTAFSIRIRCNVNWFLFYIFYLMCYCIYQQHHLTHKMKIFWNNCHVLKNLAFQCPNKSFSNNKFLCWIHFNVIYFQKPLKKIIVKFTTLINHILLGFLPFEIIFWNPLTMPITLFVF